MTRNNGVLGGLRVLVTRPPDRAAQLLTELTARGALPVLAPMHQAGLVSVAELHHLNRMMRTVAQAAAPEWLVFTSVNTVRALQSVLAGADGVGTDAQHSQRSLAPDLGVWLGPALSRGVRVAAVGSATATAVKEAGLPVHLIPPREQSSAAGLVNVWPQAPGHAPGSDAVAGSPLVHLPQSASARATLREGLQARGWRVETAVAYRMHDWPAANPLADQSGDGATPVWEPQRAREALAQGEVDAVVATAPSLLRALFAPADGKPPGPDDSVVSIACAVMGEPTLSAASELGIHAVAATAPDAAGLLDALEIAVKENKA